MSNEAEPAKTKNQGVTQRKRSQRIGVILVDEELKTPALKFFIVSMNRIQRDFEYEIVLDGIADDLLAELAKSTVLDREAIQAMAKDFPDRFKISHSKVIKDYSIADSRLPDYLVVVSMACFSDDYYTLRQPGISVIALGNWKRSMAPPSLFEFIQTLVVRESVASVCDDLRGSIHLGSRGCICDFNWLLGEARLKILNGFVCTYCREKLESAGYPALADEVERVLAKRWIGDLTKTSSVASTLAKFGVNLFVTKGLVPTWGERIMATAREDGAKELIKLLFALTLAGLLAYLGWKAGAGHTG